MNKYKGEGNEGDPWYKPYWITDQLYLYEKTQEWNKKTNNLTILDDLYMMRLHINSISNKGQMNNVIINIKKKYYSDFHMVRPYTKYSQLINIIVNAI